MFDFFIIDIAFQLVLEVALSFRNIVNGLTKLSKDRLSVEYMILKAKQRGEDQRFAPILRYWRVMMSVSTSMLNIELGTDNLHFMFSGYAYAVLNNIIY